MILLEQETIHPIVHINGTSRCDLLQQVLDVRSALSKVRDAMCAATPHARDYYVSRDPDLYRKAREQHFKRLGLIEALFTEYETLAEKLV